MNVIPRVSIMFPNFNGGSEPLDCLASIERLNYPKGKIEIIVIDNNSTDSSDIQIKRRFPKVKLIKNDENLGFAKAINQGIKASHGQYILISNDDVVFEKNSLKILINDLISDKSIGIIGGKIYSKENKNRVISNGYMFNEWTGNIHPLKDQDIMAEPHWIQGCALLIHKKLLKKAGFLDSGFNHFFEDLDLCMQVRKLGFKIIYTPDAIFWHGNSVSANKDLSQKYYYWYRNKIRFILKNLPIYNILSILFIQMLFITPYRSLVLRDGRLFPFLKGLGWNVLHLHQTLQGRRKTYA